VSPQVANSARREGGTASIELIAAIPFLLLAILAAAQIAAAGATLWSAGLAVRAGARAAVVGQDARAAALGALPAPLRREAEVDGGDPVSVRVPIPRLLPGMPVLTVGVESSLGDG
jgi:hypothetical protein